MENPNVCEGGEKKCDCKMCQKFGWCPGVCMAGKGHKVIRIVLWVVVIAFVISFFAGGHEGYKNNNIQKDTITVSGTGEKIVTPDIATVSFGVTVENMDVAKAQTEATTKMNGILDLLKGKGVAEKDIKLTNFLRKSISLLI